MQIKTFFAKSVDVAMAQAREHLGAEAMLLNTRKRPGGYELVFGLVEPESADAKSVRPTWLEQVVAKQPVSNPVLPKPEPAAAEPVEQALPPASELAELRAQMDEIRSLIVRSTRSHLNVGRTVPELAEVYGRLMSAEVDPAMSKDIVDRLESAIATDAFFASSGPGPERTANRWKALRCDHARLEAFVRAEMQRRVNIDARLGPVVVLVGPTGAGKTTSLVKLASRQPARLLTLDTARPSGHLQLQALASGLGLSSTAVQPAHSLPALIAEARSKNDLVLIDTPGYAGADLKGAAEAADLLSKCPDVEVHLVAPGYMRASDLRRCIERYKVFRPSKLLVTKLDETNTLGSVFSEAARAGLKLSFLANGPAIPADIRPASLDDFVAMVLGRRPQARAQAVA